MRRAAGVALAVEAGNLAEASRALFAAKQRSALALIGIIIGVASVSSMISVGSIVKAEAVAQFKELGTDIVNIRLRPRQRGKGAQGVTLAQAEGVTRTGAVTAVAPYTIGSGEVVLAGTRSFRAEIVGATEALADLNRLRIAQGRFVTRLDAGQHYCTIGSAVAAELAAATGGSVVGESIRIAEIGHTVIGFLEHTAEGEREIEPDRAVIIPIETAKRITTGAPLRDIVARMAPGMHYRDATPEITAYFKETAPRLKATVRSAEELIEQMHDQMRLYTLLLGTVGGISLLVGGIGVMNVMLVAVAERRSEIGLRRALGARQADIRAQFLTESVILSLAGGIIGVGAALGVTWGICKAIGWAFAVSGAGIGLGTAVAAGSGVFFGLYPAHQAARLDPVASLQGR